MTGEELGAVLVYKLAPLALVCCCALVAAALSVTVLLPRGSVFAALPSTEPMAVLLLSTKLMAAVLFSAELMAAVYAVYQANGCCPRCLPS